MSIHNINIKRGILGFLVILTFLLSGCSITADLPDDDKGSSADNKVVKSKSDPPSRSEVAKMIMQRRKGELLYTTAIGGWKMKSFKEWLEARFSSDSERIRQIMKHLRDDGYIKTNENKYSGMDKNFLQYDFTEKMQPFLIKIDSDLMSNISYYPVVAEVKDIEVTGMTAPADMFGQKMITAQYRIVPQLTPMGRYFYKDENDLMEHEPSTSFQPQGDFSGILSTVYNKGKGEATLILYDDGWRIGKASHAGF